MKVTAAVARAGDPGFGIETLDLDAPAADEILVAIAGVGICHTDLVFRQGAFGFPLPAVLGHEGAGTVVEVGSAVTKVVPGDRVVLTFRSCGTCDRCGDGDPAYCRTMPPLNVAGGRSDGSRAHRDAAGTLAGNFFGQSSFASHALAYERNVVKLPADVPLALMGPLGCGVQTGVGSILRALDVRRGASLLVTGGGTVGLSAVMAAKLRDCAPVIVVEPHASRRALALELGATHVVDPAAVSDLTAAVRAVAPLGLDYALDTTGQSALLETAMQCLGAKGVLGVVGLSAPGTPMPGNLGQLLALGQGIRGIIEGDSDPDSFIPELVDLFRAGRLPFDRLVTTFPLAEINAAVAATAAGGCVKAILLPTDPDPRNRDDG